MAHGIPRFIIPGVDNEGVHMHQNEQSRKTLAIFIKRGFNRIEAAAYIGISPTKFDQLVADGRMPKAKQIDGRRVWDLKELDPAFEELGNIDASWDDVG